MRTLDLTGQRFGRLTVVKFDGKKELNGVSYRYWKCKCDCGNMVSVKTSNLTHNNTKSCGCLRKEITSQLNYKHGSKNKRLYNIWMSMKRRCYYPKSASYANYGARNITVCNDWLGEHGFENFCSWALNSGYSEKLTLDRIDNYGNYCPENCRWASYTEQAYNRRNNVKYFYDGKNLSAREWSEITGISLGTLLNRFYNLNWSVERALTEPVNKVR